MLKIEEVVTRLRALQVLLNDFDGLPGVEKKERQEEFQSFFLILLTSAVKYGITEELLRPLYQRAVSYGLIDDE